MFFEDTRRRRGEPLHQVLDDKQTGSKASLDFLFWHFQRCEMGNLNFRFIRDGKVTSEFISLSSLFENSSKCSVLLEKHEGYNCFFGCALREGTNGKKEGILEIPSLWLELDGAPLDNVKKGQWPPSGIIETSLGKFHVYWKLREPDGFLCMQ